MTKRFTTETDVLEQADELIKHAVWKVTGKDGDGREIEQFYAGTEDAPIILVERTIDQNGLRKGTKASEKGAYTIVYEKGRSIRASIRKKNLVIGIGDWGYLGGWERPSRLVQSQNENLKREEDDSSRSLLAEIAEQKKQLEAVAQSLVREGFFGENPVIKCEWDLLYREYRASIRNEGLLFWLVPAEKKGEFYIKSTEILWKKLFAKTDGKTIVDISDYPETGDELDYDARKKVLDTIFSKKDAKKSWMYDPEKSNDGEVVRAILNGRDVIWMEIWLLCHQT